MSTRRFTTLLAGLSPKAVWRLVSADDLTTIDDPEAAERALMRALA